MFCHAGRRWLTVFLTLGVFTQTNLVLGALPSGWGDEDIGSPPQTGAGDYNNGVWIVSGGGAEIGSTNDQFNFCTNRLDGDGDIIARVLSQSSTDALAQTGVMIRNDNSATSAQASVLVTPDRGVVFCYRTRNAATAAEISVSNIAAPVWLRFSRSGDAFSAGYSSGGINWKQIGSGANRFHVHKCIGRGGGHCTQQCVG